MEWLKRNISPYSLLFLAGAFAGVGIAWPVEDFVFNVLDWKLQSGFWGQIAIATFEEGLKFGLVLIALYFTKEWTAKKIILYTVCAALGFGFMEAVVYFVRATVTQPSVMFLFGYSIGLVINLLCHIIFTLPAGLGLAYGYRRSIPLYIPILGFLVSVSLHAFNNIIR